MMFGGKYFYLFIACIGLQVVIKVSADIAPIAPMGTKPPSDNPKSLQLQDRQSRALTWNPIPNQTVIRKPVAYIIFYGTWSHSAKKLIRYFVKNLGRTAWWGINKAYGVDKLTYGGSWHDKFYSNGKALDDTGLTVFNIVENALIRHHLPNRTNGIYMVVTSNDVTMSGLGTQFCGFHTYETSTQIKFGLASAPYPGCIIQCFSPNENLMADSVVNVMAREYANAATDPDLATRKATGAESADLCAWNFFDSIKLPTSALYNLIVGKRKYYIQSNWNLALQNCSMY